MIRFFRRLLRLDFAAAWLFLLMTAAPAHGDEIGPHKPTLIEQGFHSMYNLDFVQARQDFAEYQKLHPEDPMGPVSDAAAYLFAELARLGVLESDLFVNNKAYEDRKKPPPPDPQVKVEFDKVLAKGDELSNAALQKNPNDVNARFARVLGLGLRSNYAAFIEKKDMQALKFTEQGRQDADRVLKEDPTMYDAYIALGAENYLTGIQPLPIRWMLQLGGIPADKQVGIRDMQLAADHGNLLQPFGRLLLAVAALRDNDTNKACGLLKGLAQEFPKNPLYAKEVGEHCK